MYKKIYKRVDIESDGEALLDVLKEEVEVFTKLKRIRKERDFLISWDITNGGKAGLLKLWREVD